MGEVMVVVGVMVAFMGKLMVKVVIVVVVRQKQ